jgi:hypothetical protein
MPKLVHRKQLPKQKNMGKGGKNRRKHVLKVVLKVIHVKEGET